jgi:hypothetical protein
MIKSLKVHLDFHINKFYIYFNKLLKAVNN